MKLLVQPDDGVGPLIKGIDAAKETIEILIFRFGQIQIERALVNAVNRGVRVRALIAYTNRGGEKNLRALELRLLAAGVTVARTADDLLRYHGKMIIVDDRELYLLAFNFTYLDMDRSRSFGIITTERSLVKEALRLFDADTQRHPYSSGAEHFIVSPTNARERLAAFIKGAKQELMIYDPSVSDPRMLRLLKERVEAGVKIRIIGRTRHGADLNVRKLNGLRLHTRSMVRDASDVFVGSQSLRAAELDSRREIGILVHDVRIANVLSQTFEADWAGTKVQVAEAAAQGPENAEKIAKKVAKAMTKVLPPIAPVVEIVVKEVAGEKVDIDLNPEKLQDSVKDAVRNAVKDAVREVIEDGEPEELAKKA